MSIGSLSDAHARARPINWDGSELELGVGKTPATGDAAGPQIVDAAIELYDHYFSSGDYALRYPAPNRTTLATILNAGARNARHILDFGCGNGRYSLALLEQTPAFITGYDVSAGAIAEFRHLLRQHPLGSRATLVGGPLEALANAGPFDLILMMFGVLSHVGDRAARIATLRALRRLVEPTGAALAMSVPNIFRRRPKELLKAMLDRRLGRARGAEFEDGNIHFTRVVGGQPARFFYHLYTITRLREELAEGGFQLRETSPESLLPEWMITQSPAIRTLDEAMLRWAPSSFGYGICAVADPV